MGKKIANYSKGDRVLATGKLKVTTKEDKTHYSLTADFCIKEIISGETNQNKGENAKKELEPIDDDDLPF